MPDFKKPKPNSPAKKPVRPVKNTSWGKVAPWYDDLLESGGGTYQRDLILPNVLRLLEPKKDEKILDLACGQGFFSREIFKVGAKVVGADLSNELIELAKKQSPKEIEYTVAPAEKLGFLAGNSVDAVLCVLAIQNMKNVTAVFQECARALKTDGRMLFVLNHPAFRIPKRSSWGMDADKKIQYRRIDEYISESESEIAMHPGALPGIATISFHHPLQFYFKAMHKAGLSVVRLEEWTSNKQSQPGPNAGAENKARKEFPLFLALEARKNKLNS